VYLAYFVVAHFLSIRLQSGNVEFNFSGCGLKPLNEPCHVVVVVRLSDFL
jgi:hypothetical protein